MRKPWVNIYLPCSACEQWRQRMCVDVFVCLWKCVIKSFCCKGWLWINAVVSTDGSKTTERLNNYYDHIVMSMFSCIALLHRHIYDKTKPKIKKRYYVPCLYDKNEKNDLPVRTGGAENESWNTPNTLWDTPLCCSLRVDISQPSVSLPLWCREAMHKKNSSTHTPHTS